MLLLTHLSQEKRFNDMEVVTCIELIGQSTGRDPKVTKIVLRWAELLHIHPTTFADTLGVQSKLGLAKCCRFNGNKFKFVVFHCGCFEWIACDCDLFLLSKNSTKTIVILMYKILQRRCYRETQVHKWFSRFKTKKWQ